MMFETYIFSSSAHSQSPLSYSHQFNQFLCTHKRYDWTVAKACLPEGRLAISYSATQIVTPHFFHTPTKFSFHSPYCLLPITYIFSLY